MTAQVKVLPPAVETYRFRLKHPTKGFLIAWMIDPDRGGGKYPVFTRHPGKVVDRNGYSEPMKFKTKSEALRELRELAKTCVTGSLDWIQAHDLTRRPPASQTCLLYTFPSPRD